MTGRVRRNRPVILINPLDPRHLVGVEESTGTGGTPGVSIRVSLDGGATWRQSWPLPVVSSWTSLTGPILVQDGRGNLHLALLGLCRSGKPVQLALYLSVDGGIHWSMPSILLESPEPFRYSLAADLGASASRSHVYLAADSAGSLWAMQNRHGESWSPDLNSTNNPLWAGPCFSPQVVVDTDGAVHIVWLAGRGGREILAVHSFDGGESYSDPAPVAQGVTTYSEELPEEAPITCISRDGVAVCTWTDSREGRARIYFRRSSDHGYSWQGPNSGEPMFPQGNPTHHQFRPQLVVTERAEICCAFYEFGAAEPGGRPVLDHVMVVSYDHGKTFGNRMVLSDRPLDPADEVPVLAQRLGGINRSQ